MLDLNKQGSIERAIALAEIHGILHRYAVMARDKVDFNKMAEACFHPGAVFRMPNGQSVKATEMSAVVKGDEAKYIRHHITSIDVHFKSETEARTTAQYIAFTNQSVPDHWGQWEDTFTRIGDVWLIFDRLIVVDGFEPKGWFGEKYGAEIPK